MGVFSGFYISRPPWHKCQWRSSDIKLLNWLAIFSIIGKGW